MYDNLSAVSGYLCMLQSFYCEAVGDYPNAMYLNSLRSSQLPGRQWVDAAVQTYNASTSSPSVCPLCSPG